MMVGTWEGAGASRGRMSDLASSSSSIFALPAAASTVTSESDDKDEQ
jgi:hypothetical protein